ncbi:zinc finger CCHC domain-containing protein 3-like [Alligator mississippiensis]|uniref:zinc finger CCHC domain-containing protein 3-like n=1 Tax=Alligator mississippiensis TaxID=8496 RepID=UPI0006ECB455|nr:zinc finger CCHC domain-containing protein 3-like [Alligator mississippiensis]
MAEVLLKTLKVNPRDLHCVVAFDNRKVWNVTFETGKSYAAFWKAHEEALNRGELEGLMFDMGRTARERVLYIKMFTDMAQKDDVKRWLEQRVEQVTFAEKECDRWGVWTGAWRAKVVLHEVVGSPGAVKHLASAVQIGPCRGYVVYHDQPKLCNRCGQEGHLAAFCRLTVCYRCRGLGHTAQFCKESLLCQGCGQEGHTQQTCPSSYANRVRMAGSREEPRGEAEQMAITQEGGETCMEETQVEERPEEEESNEGIEEAAKGLVEDERLEMQTQKGEEEEGREAVLQHLRGMLAEWEKAQQMEEIEAIEQGREGSLKKRKKSGGEEKGMKKLGMQTEGGKEKGKGKKKEKREGERERKESLGILNARVVERLLKTSGKWRKGVESSSEASETESGEEV